MILPKLVASSPLSVCIWGRLSREFNVSTIIVALFRSETRGKTSTQSEAEVHLISKALPQRCQIRNLKDIVRHYALSFPSIDKLLRSIIMFGLTYEGLTYRNITREYDMFNSLPPVTLFDSQDVIYTYLRFFVVKLTQNVPPLEKHISCSCKWTLFVQNVTAEVKSLNAQVSRNLLQQHVPFYHLAFNRRKTTIRNVLKPKVSHALHFITNWVRKICKAHATINDRAVSLYKQEGANISLMQTIIYSPQNQVDFHVQSIVHQFLQGGNKKTLRESLLALSLDQKVYIIAATFLYLENKMVVVRSSLPSTVSIPRVPPVPPVPPVDLYWCSGCFEVKNAFRDYTSLKSSMYDTQMRLCFCIKKRKRTCATVPLNSTGLGSSRVIINGTDVFFVCRICSTLSTQKTTLVSSLCVKCYDAEEGAKLK